MALPPRSIRATPDRSTVLQYQVSQIYSGAVPTSKRAFIGKAKTPPDYTQFELTSRRLFTLTPTAPALVSAAIISASSDLVEVSNERPSRFYFVAAPAPSVVALTPTIQSKSFQDQTPLQTVSIAINAIAPNVPVFTASIVRATPDKPLFESEDVQLYQALTTVEDLPSLYFAGGSNEPGSYRAVPQPDVEQRYSIIQFATAQPVVPSNPIFVGTAPRGHKVYDTLGPRLYNILVTIPLVSQPAFTVQAKPSLIAPSTLGPRLYNILVAIPEVIPVTPPDSLAFTGATTWRDPRRWPRRYV